jgi:hypothetical protein
MSSEDDLLHLELVDKDEDDGKTGETLKSWGNRTYTD